MQVQSVSWSGERTEELHVDAKDNSFEGCNFSSSYRSPKQRRFSASNLTSFREGASRSFRHAHTISSAASSPGCGSRDHIDPATYSFNAAIQALRTGSGRESTLAIKSICNGISLQSKWNEAEKYICNPFSGQVPIECLSARTFSGRSIATNPTKITTLTAAGFTSFPNASNKQSWPMINYDQEAHQIPVLWESKRNGSQRILTRDVGTQSTPPASGNSSSPEAIPPIKEISQLITSSAVGVKVGSHHDQQPDQPNGLQVQAIGKEVHTTSNMKKGSEGHEMFKCKIGSCFAWSLLFRKQQREKRKNVSILRPCKAFDRKMAKQKTNQSFGNSLTN